MTRSACPPKSSARAGAPQPVAEAPDAEAPDARGAGVPDGGLAGALGALLCAVLGGGEDAGAAPGVAWAAARGTSSGSMA